MNLNIFAIIMRVFGKVVSIQKELSVAEECPIQLELVYDVYADNPCQQGSQEGTSGNA